MRKRLQLCGRAAIFGAVAAAMLYGIWVHDWRPFWTVIVLTFAVAVIDEAIARWL